MTFTRQHLLVWFGIVFGIAIIMWPFIFICLKQEPFTWFIHFMISASPDCTSSPFQKSIIRFMPPRVLYLLYLAFVCAVGVWQFAPVMDQSTSQSSTSYSQCLFDIGDHKIQLTEQNVSCSMSSVFISNTLNTPSTASQSSGSPTTVPLIIVRKYYHLLAVIMFAPIILVDLAFLSLALSSAFAAFVLCETIRIMRLPPIGLSMHNFMTRYIDSRDAGYVLLTHIYLLLGCAIPVWIHFGMLQSLSLSNLPIPATAPANPSSFYPAIVQLNDIINSSVTNIIQCTLLSCIELLQSWFSYIICMFSNFEILNVVELDFSKLFKSIVIKINQFNGDLLHGASTSLFLYVRGFIHILGSCLQFMEKVFLPGVGPALSGVIVIGIGDSIASIAGKWGSPHISFLPRWPGTSKTVFGTLSAIGSMFLVLLLCSICVQTAVHSIPATIPAPVFNPSSDAVSHAKWTVFDMFVPIIMTCILEAGTEQIDNIFLPIYYFAMQLLCS
jgi:dolichol kinase